MSDNEWIFDYVLQILESDYFDAVIMDFVDENCMCFDSEDENKFIYTDLHNQFKDHVEALMTTSLKDLDVSNEVFYEALEKSRHARDINRAVFEKLLAIEDFEHFKKIMVKRNIELQLEELQEYRAMHSNAHGMSRDGDALPDPDELEQRLLSDMHKFADTTDEEMADIVRASLLEMDLIHKQEEMERMELEQALALSLLVEEERLEMCREEAKQDASNEMEDKTFYRDDFKDSAVTGSKEESTLSPVAPRAKTPPSAESMSDAKPSSKASSAPVVAPSVSAVSNAIADLDISEPKISTLRSLKALNPVGAKGSPSSKALPPISSVGLDGGGGSWVLDTQSSALEERKKLAEEAFRKNQEQTALQRRADEETKRRLLSAVGEVSARGVGTSKNGESVEDERARSMREQRDRLIAKKKQERDEKVRQEEERKRKKGSDEKASSPAKSKDASTSRFIEEQRKAGQDDTEAASRQEADEAEKKRGQVRRAMAMHMRRDLIDSEESKFRDEEYAQLADLDRKLKKVEHMYETNNQRNAVLSEQLKQQEAHLASSKRTASNLREMS